MKPHFFSFLKISLCLFALCAWQGVYATPTTPTSDFIDNGDGTVTHKKTGLIWQRCAVGQTWTGSDCSGEAKTFTYDEAMALKSDFAGQSDWRVPNIAELQTIVEPENSQPAINNTIFPDTLPSSWFWSSSPLASSSNDARTVSFGDGYDGGGNKDCSNLFVRLVRGGQWTFGSLPLTTPTADFVNHGNGTVTHKRTGLMWQQCAVGQTPTDSGCSGSASVVTYDDALKLTSDFAGYSDWRLPTLAELGSIVEYGKYSPAINSVIFTNTPNSGFWSSSPYANGSNYAWIVGFAYGSQMYNSKSISFATRLVRGTWSAPSSSSKLDLTQANCRYVAPFYNSIWQQMKTKNAPSCKAALNYYTWTKFTRPENKTASDYYSNRLNGIDTTNQIINASLQGIDASFSALNDALDPDLKQLLSNSGYQATSDILKSKGILASLKSGQSPFKLNPLNLKGRFLNKAITGIVLDKGISEASSRMCKLLSQGAVADSCANESKKIAACAMKLATEGMEGVSTCVMGGITSVTGLINNIYDIGQIVAIKQHNYGYILINDYLNDYYAKGSTVTALDEAKLAADIENYANQLALTNGLFSFDDYDMQFVKDGIRDAILRNLVTANRNVSLAERLRKLLAN